MYLIVGLGNPEEEYARTRHNMGFDTINKLAKKYKIEVNKTKFNGLCGTGNIEGEKVILVKPQTYMNLSGQTVRDFMNFYKLSLNDLIVIYDDIDIEPGKIRIKKSGRPGTHNGIKSVTKELGTINFCRVMVGIGKPEYENDLINYVTNKIEDEEYTVLEEGIEKAENGVVTIIKQGIDRAMNLFN